VRAPTIRRGAAGAPRSSRPPYDGRAGRAAGSREPRERAGSRGSRRFRGKPTTRRGAACSPSPAVAAVEGGTTRLKSPLQRHAVHLRGLHGRPVSSPLEVDREFERPNHAMSEALHFALGSDPVAAGVFVLFSKAILLHQSGLELRENFSAALPQFGHHSLRAKRFTEQGHRNVSIVGPLCPCTPAAYALCRTYRCCPRRRTVCRCSGEFTRLVTTMRSRKATCADPPATPSLALSRAHRNIPRLPRTANDEARTG
jgi:hypothetical protein